MLHLLSRTTRALIPLPALLATATLAGGQTLWVVDNGGSGDFTQVQPAVDASADGDTILVRSGNYGHLTVTNKELTIVAVGAAVSTGDILVNNLSPNRTVVLQGFTGRVAGDPSRFATRRLRLNGCAGSVWIRDCTFASWGHSSWAGRISNCENVSLSSCTFLGSRGQDGLLAIQSKVALYGCSCEGGPGSDSDGSYYVCAGDGGHGASVSGNGEFFAAETSFFGGGGGYGGDLMHCYAADGGHGILSSQADCRLIDCQAEGGEGGCTGGFPADWGEDGDPTSGSVTVLHRNVSRTKAPGIALSGSNVTLTFEGAAGFQVFLLASMGPAHEYITQWRSVLSLAQPLLAFLSSTGGGGPHLPHIPLDLPGPFLGTIPASGVLDVQVPVESLVSGAPADTFFLQALVRNSPTVSLLSDPIALTVIDCPGSLADCNANGILDFIDVTSGTSSDCDGNLIPDECEPDCNLDGIPDGCEPDCNGNGVPDECDIADGTSPDVNEDGIPDDCQGGSRVYVDEAALPGGTGLSWASPLDDLQIALEFASGIPGGTEIWVAEGIYRPAAPGGLDCATFLIGGGTLLYGGFAGDETSLSRRDPLAHPTLLSGDLNGDDPGGGSTSDNVDHVVTIMGAHPSRRLDGFVVSGGHAVDMTYYGSGGGVHVFGGATDWTIANCVIEGNYAAESGGGLRATFASGEIINTIFRGNVAGEGGGFAGVNSHGAIFVNCVFSGNRAGTGGGLMDLDSRDQLYIGCTFANNIATTGYGGGAYFDPETPSTRLRSCIAWGNTAAYGSTETQQIFAPSAGVQACYSCIERLTSIPGHDNIRIDPLFVDAFGSDGVAGTADDDLRLGPGSPCVDSSFNPLLPPDTADIDHDGDTLELIPLDLDGNRRLFDDPAAPNGDLGPVPLLDMGALERVP